MTDAILAEFKRSAETISNIDPKQVRAAADILLEAFRNGGQVIFMGNGGSSADAQHIAAEFSGRYLLERPALPSICLSNIAPVTAIGNDYSYDVVFQRQIEANCRKGDVVIGMSTSGNSKNVILAIEKAKDIGAKTISFTGDGGKLKDIVDCAVVIPSKETPRIQEAYLCACHTMCGIVERELFGSRCVFIDRDDTIAKDVPYCNDPAKFHLFEGVPQAIRRLNDAGFLVIVVTNQSGLGRGYFDLPTLESIHSKMRADVEAGGGRIDDIFYCPHRPEDNCSCRKPEIGLGIQAIMRHGINPVSSYMIGDSDKDVLFGQRLGCRTIKVGPGMTFVDAVECILKDSDV